MNSNNKKVIEIDDGSKIAVIGGGPAGSFFAYFALEFAQRVDINVKIDIYEAKNFNLTGPPGCNHCGGIVSESLVQQLSTEGIVLPSSVIRRGIQSYAMHFEQGSTLIDTPFNEQRIASMFRGFGPKGSEDNEQLSFDNYLLDLSVQKGANAILEKVTELERKPEGVYLKTNSGKEEIYDLVVGAVGLNKRTLELFKSINPSYIEPELTRTYICEFKMESDEIDKYFGNSMHVFLLDLPKIKFGALIPKGEYVTMVLLGSDINKEVVKDFLDSKAVRNCFPQDLDIYNIMPCQCYPYINVRGARSAFGDRIILIGDSASSKLYKNGIGAAYITAKAAAKTVIFNGITEKDFKKNYLPVCKNLDRDNMVGKFIFIVTTVIQKTGILKKGVLRMVVEEQKKSANKRVMSSVLWDTFTGSSTYTSILRRTTLPLFIINLIRHTIAGLFQKETSYEIKN